MQHGEPIILENAHVRLEPLAPRHADDLAVAASGLEHAWDTSAPSPDAVPAEIAKRLRLRDDGMMNPWAVVRPGCCCCSLHVADPVRGAFSASGRGIPRPDGTIAPQTRRRHRTGGHARVRSGGWESILVVLSQRTHKNGREGGGSMRTRVVCGAGASSTVVAQRVQHAAHDRGLPCTASARTERLPPIDLDAADILLVGPRLSGSLDQIERNAVARGALVVLLPDDVVTDVSGERTLDLVETALRTQATRAANCSAREKGSPMPPITPTVRIGSSRGLHARPAKLFASAAKNSGIPVTIAKEAGSPVNAASILGVIALGLDQGDDVTLTADGDNAEATLDARDEPRRTDHDAA